MNAPINIKKGRKGSPLSNNFFSHLTFTWLRLCCVDIYLQAKRNFLKREYLFLILDVYHRALRKN